MFFICGQKVSHMLHVYLSDHLPHEKTCFPSENTYVGKDWLLFLHKLLWTPEEHFWTKNKIWSPIWSCKIGGRWGRYRKSHVLSCLITTKKLVPKCPQLQFKCFLYFFLLEQWPRSWDLTKTKGRKPENEEGYRKTLVFYNPVIEKNFYQS